MSPTELGIRPHFSMGFMGYHTMCVGVTMETVGYEPPQTKTGSDISFHISSSLSRIMTDTNELQQS